jgi:hypothetical protein
MYLPQVARLSITKGTGFSVIHVHQIHHAGADYGTGKWVVSSSQRLSFIASLVQITGLTVHGPDNLPQQTSQVWCKLYTFSFQQLRCIVKSNIISIPISRLIQLLEARKPSSEQIDNFSLRGLGGRCSQGTWGWAAHRFTDLLGSDEIVRPVLPTHIMPESTHIYLTYR